MQARPADDMDDPYEERQWAGGLAVGLFRDLYRDTSHDGIPDGLEVTEGTDPLDPGSGFAHIYLPVTLRGYAGP